MNRPRAICADCGGPAWGASKQCQPCYIKSFGTAIDRIMSSIRIDDNGCWISTKGVGDKGYAYVRVGGYRKVFRHRLTYEHFVGPIPDGMQIDHLCNQPSCCNPDHLEPVTQAQNMRRAALRRERPPSTSPACGSRSTYRNHGCRCRPCTDANREYLRQWNQRRKEAS